MSESTITPPSPLSDVGTGDDKVIQAIVDGVHVAASVRDRRGWVVTSTLAREVPQLVAKDEADARRFLVFLAELYTGRFGRTAVSA